MVAKIFYIDESEDVNLCELFIFISTQIKDRVLCTRTKGIDQLQARSTAAEYYARR